MKYSDYARDQLKLIANMLYAQSTNPDDILKLINICEDCGRFLLMNTMVKIHTSGDIVCHHCKEWRNENE